MNTVFQHRGLQKYLVQIFGPTVIHWFLHSFSWLVPISFKRSCHKVCGTLDRSPLAGLQPTSWATIRIHTNAQVQEALSKGMGGPGGQRCKKDLCRECIVLVRRDPGMHSGRKGGVVVQTSRSFICCSGMPAEATWCGKNWHKINPVVEPEGERCYSSKESSLTSAQSPIFFPFAVHWGTKVRRHQRWKSPKCNLGRTQTRISNTN